MAVALETGPADARRRLLEAAVDVFGRAGFAGASTRELAKRAGVNLQAINYYFGSKDGLYLAAADHVAALLHARVGPAAERARARLADGRSGKIPAEEARRLAAGMLGAIAGTLFEPDWTPIGRFIAREQMDPTKAFDRIYERGLEPALSVAAQLVGIALGESPRSRRVRLRALSLLGSVVFLRIAQATTARQLGWSHAGPRERAALRELIADVAGSLGRGGKGRS